MEGAMVQSKLAPRCFLLESFSATPTEVGTAQGTQVLADTRYASSADYYPFFNAQRRAQKLPTGVIDHRYAQRRCIELPCAAPAKTLAQSLFNPSQENFSRKLRRTHLSLAQPLEEGTKISELLSIFPQ